jgi:hypothetical protein
MSKSVRLNTGPVVEPFAGPAEVVATNVPLG